jgi:hypothetical protein
MQSGLVRGGLFGPGFERGANNEPLWRRADIAEWIAGHERQRRIVGRVEYPHILRLDDRGSLHEIAKHPVLRRDTDLVIGIDVAQLAEERVAMAGETDIPDFARQGSARYVADCQA